MPTPLVPNFRGVYATYQDLPNVSASSTQDRSIRYGDLALCTDRVGGLTDGVMFCVDPTPNAARWSAYARNESANAGEVQIRGTAYAGLRAVTLAQVQATAAASAIQITSGGTVTTGLGDNDGLYSHIIANSSATPKRITTSLGDTYLFNRSGFDDNFVGGFNALHFAVTGTGSPTAPTASAEGGVVALTSSAGGSDSAILFSPTNSLFLTRATNAFMRATISILTNVNNKVVICGISDAATPVNNYSIFRYENGINSGNWQCITRSATTTQTTNTAVIANTAGIRLAIQETSAGVLFYINDALVATNSTQMPSVNTLRGPLISTTNKTTTSTGIWVHHVTAFSTHR